MCKDYYVYQHAPFYKYNRSIPGDLHNYINASFTIPDLKNNITIRKPFKDGLSIKDLVDLGFVKGKEELFRNFELSITKVLDK